MDLFTSEYRYYNCICMKLCYIQINLYRNNLLCSKHNILFGCVCKLLILYALMNTSKGTLTMIILWTVLSLVCTQLYPNLITYPVRITYNITAKAYFLSTRLRSIKPNIRSANISAPIATILVLQQ